MTEHVWSVTKSSQTFQMWVCKRCGTMVSEASGPRDEPPRYLIDSWDISKDCNDEIARQVMES